jgi:hypothetical protein
MDQPQRVLRVVSMYSSLVRSDPSLSQSCSQIVLYIAYGDALQSLKPYTATASSAITSQRSSSPRGVDQACSRINENATDNEQDRPDQIIKLFLKVGESPRCLLRSPSEDGTQQENSRHGSRN